MVFPIVGGTQDTGYEISNSLRFDGSSSYLYHTHQSGNKDTFTFSSWIKFGDLDNDTSADVLFSVTNTGYVIIRFEDKQLDYLDYDGSDVATVSTNRLFRDVSAWYHIVVAIDMTQSTDSNRVKLYVNGSQESSFATATYQPQNQDTVVNTAAEHRIGRESGNYFSGYMADVNFIDGTAYAASDFGETNDNGVWIPKKPAVTYGTNGYRLEFKQTGTSANASGIGADTSGQGNHHSVSGLAATDITTDTPQNNFCTLNPLDNAVLTLSEGNTKATHSTSSGGEENRATLGAANGKWYFEFQIQHTVGSLNPFAVGMMSNTGQTPLESDLKSTEAFTSAWHTDSSTNRIESRVSGSSTNLNCNLSYPDDGDIVNVAMDLDNGRVYFGKNGTYINDASGNTGNPSTGANPPVSFTTGGHFYFPAIHNRGSQGLTVSLNTGNPSFSISSGNADANGYGNFEYAVPSGYYALCTKNLAEYG